MHNPLKMLLVNKRAMAVLFSLSACMLWGCYFQKEKPTLVGPSPLRRLSNTEYLNALSDLFPEQHLTLPPLPNDTTIAGFENAAEAQQPSDVRIARYETIANLYAEAATHDTTAVQTLVGCNNWSTPSLANMCALQFIEKMGSRLFRRPLLADERDQLMQHFGVWQTSVDFEGAVQLTLSSLLQSPQFLYRPEPISPADGRQAIIPVEAYAMASRLSFFLWESVPDDALLQAASRNELQTVEQISAQAQRMIQDERVKRVFWDFHRQWLGLDRILQDEHLVRTSQIDPNWTAATQTSAHHESELFIENILMDTGSFKDMLTSKRAWLNGETARLYQVPSPIDPSLWAETVLPESQRSGLLTRLSFLAGNSHRGATSPPVRGNAIQLRLLCQLPQPPPKNADLSQPKADPAGAPQTNRMLFETRTKSTECQGCHYGLNGFGFGFENYDAAGVYQIKDNGLDVDAHGEIHGTDVDQKFNGAIALSEALSRSRTVYQCSTAQWVRYALGRAPTTEELPMVEAIGNRFVASGGDVRKLLLDIVTTPSFRMREVF